MKNDLGEIRKSSLRICNTTWTNMVLIEIGSAQIWISNIQQ